MDAKKVRVLGHFLAGRIADAEVVDIGMLKDPGTSYKKKTYVEIPIEAEKRLNFAFVGGRKTTVCRLTMSFLPKTGRQYEAAYHMKGAHCHGTVSELVQTADTVIVTREMSTKKKDKACKSF